MSANVETMFYVREKPWHGLGIRVGTAPTSIDALVLAGLDWEVVQKDVYTENGSLIAGYKINTRSTAGRQKSLDAGPDTAPLHHRRG